MKKKRENKKNGAGALKLMESAMSLLFIAFMIVLVSGYFPFSHQLITRYVCSLAEKKILDSCAIEKVTLTPWKGITVHDLSATGKTGETAGYRVHLSKIRINCSFIGIVSKWQSYKQAFEQLQKDFSQPASMDIGGAINLMLRFAAQKEEIKGIYINGKTLEFSENGTPFIDANRFSFDIIRDTQKPRNMNLALEAAELVYLKNDITFLKAAAVFDNRILDIGRCGGRVFGGKVKISAGLDLQNRRILNGTLNASDLDLGRMTAPMGGVQGSVCGKADIDLNMASSLIALDSIKGKGVIRGRDVNFENTPVQKSLVKLLENPLLNELSFNKVRTDFEIIDKNSIQADISGSGDMLDFKSKGLINPQSGWFNQQVMAEFSDDAIKELPRFVVNSMVLNENKRRSVRCRIYGTLNSPKVELDKEILKKAIGNVFEQVKENFRDFFRKK